MSMNVRPPACSRATAAAEVEEDAEVESEFGEDGWSLIALLLSSSLIQAGGVRRRLGRVAEADLLDHRRRILPLAHRRRALGREPALIALGARRALGAGSWSRRRHRR